MDTHDLEREAGGAAKGGSTGSLGIPEAGAVSEPQPILHSDMQKRKKERKNLKEED